MPVDGSQLVALMEGELCGGTQARHVESAQLTDSETGRRDDVETTAEGGLTNSPALIKQERVQIDQRRPGAISSTRFGRQSSPRRSRAVEDVERLSL